MSKNYNINTLIELAKSEVGYLEKKDANVKYIYDKTKNAGSNNYNKYAYDLDTKYPNYMNGKKNGYSWCACFISWLFITAYGEADAHNILYQPIKGYGAGCVACANYYKSNNAYDKSPKIGDQVIFKDSSGEPCHTGLVIAVDNSSFTTIEGNTSCVAGVIENGGAVEKKVYSKTYSRIHGFGHPCYGDQSKFEKKTVATTKNTTTSTKVKSKSNPDIKAWQNAVIADKYVGLASGADGIWGKECETLAKKIVVKKRLTYKDKNLTKFVQNKVGVTVDGKFGSDTKKAVIKYQKNNKLAQDGEVGYNTWKKMCGVK